MVLEWCVQISLREVPDVACVRKETEIRQLQCPYHHAQARNRLLILVLAPVGVDEHCGEEKDRGRCTDEKNR